MKIIRLTKTPGVWIELAVGFDTEPFQDPLQMEPAPRQMEEIQKWCQEHKCGIRMSFDQIVFRTEAELDMFMLRWA
jgi:hypothetical protein